MGSERADSAGVSTPHHLAALREMTQRYEQLVRGYSILRQIDQIDHPDLDLEQVCLRLIQTVARGFAAENCSLMLLDESASELVLCAATSALDEGAHFMGTGLWTGKRFRLGEGIAGQAAASGRTIRCDDVNAEVDYVRIPDSPVLIHALMSVPLKVGAQLVGVVNLSHSQPGFFSADSERIMSLIGDRCARLVASHLVHHERRRAEDYYRLVSEKVGDAVLVFDGTDKLINANSVAEQLSGVPLAVLLSGETRWEAGVLPEDREKFAAHRARVATSRRNESLEYRYRDTRGLIHFLDERSSILTDASGVFQGYVCVLRDVTERKRIEQEKQQLEAQLRHAQKMEAVGQLAGGIAHDFNNLQTGIMGNISLARSLGDVPTIRRLLGEAEKASMRAAELTKQLLTMSRRSQVAKKPVELRTLLKELENIVRNTFDRRITISIQIGPGLWSVMASPDQIHQVLLNLCVNARDALLEKHRRDETAPLRLDIAVENAEIDDAFCNTHIDARPGAYVQLTVSDTGIGIDKAIQNRVFDPFFTTKDAPSGTGLGLSIVYGIVREHGGWITLSSEAGSGASFHVFLPATMESVTSARETGQDPLYSSLGGTETILLVDDEEIIRSLGKSILERHGYTVLLACDGKEALDLYARHRDRVGVMVLDLSMPTLSGEEVLRQVRTMSPDVKIIVSTGHTFDAPVRLRGKFAPTAYLRKPYTYLDVTRTIRRVLDASLKPQRGSA